MESKTQFHKLILSDIEFLPEEVLNLLKEYNIFTIGQLLGATKGITNVALFAGLENKEELVNKLLQFIPEHIREQYRNFSDKHPTGLLILPKNEDNSENIK